jgi:hypothetical protein
MNYNIRRKSDNRLKLPVIVTSIILLYIFFALICFFFLTNNVSNVSELASSIRNIENEIMIDNNHDEHHEKHSPHFLAVNGISYNLCKEENLSGNNFIEGIEILDEKAIYKQILIGGDDKYPDHYNFQFCPSPSFHQHEFKFQLIANDFHKSDCDMYFSVDQIHPSNLVWDWKSNSIGQTDSITIHSYSKEYQSGKYSSLFISVYSKSVDFVNNCTFIMEVKPVNPKELLSKLGLRGGKVLMPRDVPYLEMF